MSKQKNAKKPAARKPAAGKKKSVKAKTKKEKIDAVGTNDRRTAKSLEKIKAG